MVSCNLEKVKLPITLQCGLFMDTEKTTEVLEAVDHEIISYAVPYWKTLIAQLKKHRHNENYIQMVASR